MAKNVRLRVKSALAIPVPAGTTATTSDGQVLGVAVNGKILDIDANKIGTATIHLSMGGDFRGELDVEVVT